MFTKLRQLGLWLAVWNAWKALVQAVRNAWAGGETLPPEKKDAEGWTETGRKTFERRSDPADTRPPWEN